MHVVPFFFFARTKLKDEMLCRFPPAPLIKNWNAYHFQLSLVSGWCGLVGGGCYPFTSWITLQQATVYFVYSFWHFRPMVLLLIVKSLWQATFSVGSDGGDGGEILALLTPNWQFLPSLHSACKISWSETLMEAFWKNALTINLKPYRHACICDVLRVSQHVRACFSLFLKCFQVTCQCLARWKANHLGQLHNKQG